MPPGWFHKTMVTPRLRSLRAFSPVEWQRARRSLALKPSLLCERFPQKLLLPCSSFIARDAAAPAAHPHPVSLGGFHQPAEHGQRRPIGARRVARSEGESGGQECLEQGDACSELWPDS